MKKAASLKDAELSMEILERTGTPVEYKGPAADRTKVMMLYYRRFLSSKREIGWREIEKETGLEKLKGDEWMVAHHFIMRHEITRLHAIIGIRNSTIDKLMRQQPTLPTLIKKFPEYFNYQEVTTP